MRLQIVRLGQTLEIDVSEADLIQFEAGVIGFEECRRFALAPDPEGGILWLHAAEGEPFALPLVDPFLIWPDYDVTVSDADAAALELERPEDAELLVIITPREDPSQISANLRAPLVINRRLRRGRQIILPDATYAIRAPMLEALTARSASALETAAPTAEADETDAGAVGEREAA